MYIRIIQISYGKKEPMLPTLFVPQRFYHSGRSLKLHALMSIKPIKNALSIVIAQSSENVRKAC